MKRSSSSVPCVTLVPETHWTLGKSCLNSRGFLKSARMEFRILYLEELGLRETLVQGQGRKVGVQGVVLVTVLRQGLAV